MKLFTYRLKVRHNEGSFIVTTTATSSNEAIRIIMNSEKCPKNAIIEVIEVKETKIRTAREWLTESKELPFWIRRRALEGMDQRRIDRVFISIKNVIFFGIIWDETEEGADFWISVYNHLVDQSPLPKASSVKKSK